RSEVRRHYASSQGVRFAIPPPCRLTRARLASGHRQPAEVARGGRWATRRFHPPPAPPVGGSPLGAAGQPGSHSASALDEIIASVREQVEARQRRCPLEQLRDQAAEAPPVRDAYSILRRPGVGVIAEIKRASPSAGPLADIPDPAALAQEYET